MRFSAMRIGAVVGAFALLLGIAACAPTNTNTTYTGAAIGRSAQVSRGTILSMRAVAVQNQEGAAVGTGVGAVAGGVAGSFIGGDPRSNILGGLAGAVIGGVAGHEIGKSVSTGDAVEFVIREEGGGTISVVQTNELNFHPGERVLIIRGDRTRLARPEG
jgi:outer membrane lipoprotein SlyB